MDSLIEKKISNLKLQFYRSELKVFLPIVLSCEFKIKNLPCDLATDGVSILLDKNYMEGADSTPEDLLFGVLHEVLHILLEHVARSKKMGNAQLANIACDYIVNNICVEDYGILVDADKYYVGEYSGLSFEAIYKKLLKNPPEEKEKLRKFVVKSNKTEKDTPIKSKVYECVEFIRKSDPNGVMNVTQHVLEISPVMRIDWRVKLATYMREEPVPRLNMKRLNKRLPFPSFSTERVDSSIKKIVVSIDVSASVDTQLLSTFFSELQNIVPFSDDIQVLLFNTEVIQSIKLVEFDSKFINSLVFGGGTDLTAPFEYIIKNKIKSGIHIIFSDLLAYRVPKLKKYTKYDTIWIVPTCEEHKLEVNFGDLTFI